MAAEILEGTVPLNRDDVQGVVMGTATFDWKASGSTILPGAICDNFTSFGGAINAAHGQTPLSRVPPLRRGRRQRHRDRAVRHRRQVPLAHDPGPLRPRLHAWPRRSISRSMALTSC